VADDVAASVKGGGVDGRAPGWPKGGQSPGRPMAAVAAVHDAGGGGGERKGWDCHNMVTFQPQLLDLATRGHY